MSFISSSPWIGVVLDEPKGRMNGTFLGTRYFECADKHGIFVRQCQLNVVEKADSQVVEASGHRKKSKSDLELCVGIHASSEDFNDDDDDDMFRRTSSYRPRHKCYKCSLCYHDAATCRSSGAPQQEVRGSLPDRKRSEKAV